VMFDPVVEKPAGELASAIVWFDAFVTNIDRTARNTNMLMWHRKLWLIDHGAGLYFHHAAAPGEYVERARDPFPLVKDHVLLPLASGLAEADATMAARLTPEAIRAVVGLVPDAWLDADPAAHRRAYAEYLAARLRQPRAFVEEAIRARSMHV